MDWLLPDDNYVWLLLVVECFKQIYIIGCPAQYVER